MLANSGNDRAVSGHTTTATTSAQNPAEMASAHDDQDAVTPGVGGLRRFMVPGIPDAIYYIPDFVTAEEGEALMAEVYAPV